MSNRITTKQFLKLLKKRSKEERAKKTGVKWQDCKKMTPEQFDNFFKD